MADEIRLQFSTTVSSWTWRPPFLTNWASIAIRRFCHSAYSHVDFCLPDGSMLGASDSADAPVIAGNPRGVAIRPAQYEIYGRKCMAILKTDKASAVIGLAMAQLGKPFDNSTLHGFLSDRPGNRNWRSEAAWACSELCAYCLEQAGFFPYKLISAKNRITPADLLLLLNGSMTEDSIEQFNRIEDLRGLQKGILSSQK